MSAFEIPFLRVPDCLVKKETVNGIIGNTQGVRSAINPPKNPSKNRVVSSFPSLLESELSSKNSDLLLIFKSKAFDRFRLLVSIYIRRQILC